VVSPFYTQDNHTPTISNTTEISVNFSDFVSKLPINSNPIKNKDNIVELLDQSSNTGVIGSLGPSWTDSISVVNPKVQKNAISPNIPNNTILIFILTTHLQHWVYEPTHKGFLFYISNRDFGQSTSLKEISNKSENNFQKSFGRNSPFLFCYLVLGTYSRVLKFKEQNVYHLPPHELSEYVLQTVCHYSFYSFCVIIGDSIAFLLLSFFIVLFLKNHNNNVTMVTQMGDYPSIEITRFVLLLVFSKWIISLPITQFLGIRKYPLFLIEPSSSIPLFHPNCSISFGGITIVYLYIGFPLYSRALCFCNFIFFRINLYLKNVVPQTLYTPVALLYMATEMSEINIKEMINARKARGMILLEQGFEPKELTSHSWIVPSQNGCGTYQVSVFQRHWKCSCPDYLKRGVECKHICAVKIWKNLRNKFEQVNLHIEQNIGVKEKIPVASCKFCNSLDIIKYGTKSGKQVYKCKDCNRKFVDNIDFENMKYDSKIIALTLDLYFRGFSLRKVAHHLKQFYNLNISYMTVHRWIEKYIGVMNEYVNTLQPDIGDVWHTDEMMVNIGGDWEYLWNCMDERTRFQLASVVSKERKVRDARMVFKKAKKNCGGRKPKYIVTDGLGSYKRAIKKEFLTNTHETEHLYNVGLQHHPNNNHVERLHGEIRSREKTMRAVKTEETPIVEGHRLYYNFIKPHMALNGKTPSEEAGITIEGDNKWLSLMKTALWYKKVHSEVV
jgi:transposase-like protein